MVDTLFICMILITMALVAFVAGSGILHVLYGKRQEDTFRFADALLLGTIAVIGTAEAAHLAALFAKLTFSACVKIFGALTAFLVLAALAVISMKFIPASNGPRRRAFQTPTEAERRPDTPPLGCPSPFMALFVLIALSQALYIAAGGGVYLRGDMTVETVESFLFTDGIYQVNPLTGAAYQEGIPLRLEILCLPTLYGVLCRLSGLDARTAVWTVVPLMTLLLSYSAFSCLGRCLFPADRKKREGFLVVVGLLLWVGGYHYVMDGFGVLYGGFRGIAIRNAVLIPYLLSLCLRKRWAAAFLCIAAEACIVWTLYGAGACLLTAAAMAAFVLAGHKAGKKHGEGAAK